MNLGDPTDVQDRAMTWETLGYEAGLHDVSGHTVQRAMGRLDYHKCIACRRGWVSKDVRERRVEFARRMLAKYPLPEQWKRVRFSDEVHFGLGPQGRLMIIRRPGERYCISCIQEADEPCEEDKKKLHAWAAIGYEFKSDLVFYDIPSNTNGKMTMKAYEQEIFEKHVKPWIERGDDFVLEEDRDSGHGIGSKKPDSKLNQIQIWKEKHGLKSYFNMSSSPDLSPSENGWQPLKSYIRKFNHWEKEETRQLAYEGWHDHIEQRTINKWVLSMPERLQAVIDAEGRMTGY